MAVTLTSTGITFSDGTSLSTVPSGGHTISIGTGTTTISSMGSCGTYNWNVTMASRSFFPNVALNYNGMASNSGKMSAIVGNSTSIPGVSYSPRFTLQASLGCDHSRGARARVSYEYLTYS